MLDESVKPGTFENKQVPQDHLNMYRVQPYASLVTWGLQGLKATTTLSSYGPVQTPPPKRELLVCKANFIIKDVYPCYIIQIWFAQITV